MRDRPSRRATRAAARTHGRRGPTFGGHLHRIALSVVTRALEAMLRLGIRFGPMTLLTVRGRTSGLPRTNPVDLFERDGRFWLVATHDAGANWVRNLRAAGEGTLVRGRRGRNFTAVELSQADAGCVLQDVLGPRLARPLAGLVLRQTLQVAHDASVEDFVETAAQHPVFELTMT